MRDQLEHIATARHPGEIWELSWVRPDGQVVSRKLGGVHFTEDCETEHCVLHNPSEHSMRDFPLHWRDDRQIFERICEHGVGHPDPDQEDFWTLKFGPGNTQGIHGCDGCCWTGEKVTEPAFGGGPNLTGLPEEAPWPTEPPPDLGYTDFG